MSINVRRRSRRLEEKNKELSKSWATTDSSCSSIANYNVGEKNIATSSRKDTRKRKGNISTSEDQLQDVTIRKIVKVKSNRQDEKLKNRINTGKTKRKRSPGKLANKAKGMEDSAPKKKLNKRNKKCEDPKATSSLSYDGSSSNCSDDEWENVDGFDFCKSALSPTASIEITITKPKMKVKPTETVETRRARYVKRHVFFIYYLKFRMGYI